MHIPDGYISPLMTLGSGAITVPVWAVATRKVTATLNNRTVPLLAIFSALCFTIMMFNIPVPGGTTAHAVGGTLAAIVLGPWAACIVVSVALIIQALFFGDGGILAIFLNCLTMAIVLPFTGYVTYRMVAARAPLLSTRRAVAAGIGGYVGITAAALLAGVFLGLQPILFTDAAGRPLYSPYDLQAAIPAMLISHLFGAAIVEALVTGLGVAYLQKRHPDLLVSQKSTFAGDDQVVEGQATQRPMWQLILAVTVAAIAVLGVIGLVIGGGNPDRFFGADWSTVSWPEVGAMLLVTALIAVVLVPLVYLVLPRRLKRVGAGLTAIAVIAPLGLIAPGFAYGEGSAEDVQAAFGYIPTGLHQLSSFFGAPLSGYNIPLPFFSGASSGLWQAGIGYEIAGIIGFLLCGGAVLLLAGMLGRMGRSSPSPEPSEPAEAPSP